MKVNLATVEVLLHEYREMGAQKRCWGIKSKVKGELGCDQKRVLVQDREKGLENEGPKYRGRAQGKLKRTREAKRMIKSQKDPNSELTARPRPQDGARRALLSLIWKFPLVARLRDPDGAPVPPHFATPKTRTSRAYAATAELT
ncbi:hypothetical protein PIB30_060750 [Stylosanthes scabra]|uniref:Uncharacterized protein n=1 Tax=Stylosanthes scabra TaxID=79078 RepID=A0ABU6UN19_9FABA|nr:hypothetical protein [Stylosanthes scabra]